MLQICKFQVFKDSVKKDRARFIANLVNQLSEKRKDMQVLENALEEKLEQIEILESRKEDAEQAVIASNKKAEIASKKAETAKKNLQAIAPLANNVKSFAGNYVGFGAKELPEAGVLETEKSYREKKAIPFVEKLRDILFSLYREYCKLQDKYERLERDCDEGWERKARWERRCGDLEERVKESEEVEKDYGRVRNVLGFQVVDRMVQDERRMEMLKREAEKEKRKLQRKNSRDVR